MFIFCQRSKIVDRTEISAICDPILTSFWVKESQTWYIFSVWSRHFCQGGSPATPLKSATLWRSCCLKTTLVIFVAENCWFYQKLKKIGTTNENWALRQGGGKNLLPICCHRGPPPICCQFVILLKSYSWQHMWSSISIFKNCQNSRFFENLRFLDWFWFELSSCARDAIFDAGSNIASLLPVFNKNVVFRHQMLIFHVCSYLFM